MTLLTKWCIALVCVLVAVGLMLGYSHGGIPLAQKIVLPTKQLPNKLAEQQLAHGLALWRNKSYQQASQVFSLLSAKNLSAELQSLTELYQYHATAFDKNNNAEVIQQRSSLPDDCQQKLLFVTPDIESLAQAEQLRSRFADDQRLHSLSICIFDVTWFDPLDITCEENWQLSGRLGCQLLLLPEKLKSIPFTHLVMFADKGKANVHNGIMFLDRMDTYDVFIHELAHFAGFIDEYPLSQSLAKRVCAGVDAPNIVFKQAAQSTPAQLTQEQAYWRSTGLHNNTDIFAARTCDNHAAQAFKTSKKMTFMEYHDTAYIPAHYLTAWQKQLQTTPNQPTAHINFAQLYEQSNNLTESQFWRAKYQKYVMSAVNRVSHR